MKILSLVAALSWSFASASNIVAMALGSEPTWFLVMVPSFLITLTSWVLFMEKK